MLIQACLNGPRVPGERPALPCTPEELASAARAAVAAGAGSLHSYAALATVEAIAIMLDGASV